ncbi:hypothetical protein F5Y12DRAFT_328575 [Xylaria sp. FL1777]|nr:hypothetical protein F5Y12DRAFT_328575 [Xylaria sp. FL1777]
MQLYAVGIFIIIWKYLIASCIYAALSMPYMHLGRYYWHIIYLPSFLVLSSPETFPPFFFFSGFPFLFLHYTDSQILLQRIEPTSQNLLRTNLFPPRPSCLYEVVIAVITPPLDDGPYSTTAVVMWRRTFLQFLTSTPQIYHRD